MLNTEMLYGNISWKTMQHYYGNIFVECKTTTWHLHESFWFHTTAAEPLVPGKT
jgi:hypothetical protein